jgi:hypothetical protein
MTESQTDPTLVVDDDPYADGFDEPLPPPRPRRRLLTPLTGALAALILAAGGFVAGVQVQKGQTGGASSSSAGAAGARAGGFAAGRAGGAAPGGPGGAAAGGQAAPTVGTVANTHGSTLYVVTNAGVTVRVRPVTGSKVTRTAESKAAAVHPGDTVIVQGTTAPDGTLKATSIAATAAGAASGAGSLFGGAGGAPGG